MTPTDSWEKAIATRLQPLRETLKIPITALPKSAGEFIVWEGKNLIDFLFSSTAVTARRINSETTQETLSVRIYLGDRYSDDPTQKIAINWVCWELRKLLNNYDLPSASKPLYFKSQRLFAPQGGTWYVEQDYVFEANFIL